MRRHRTSSTEREPEKDHARSKVPVPHLLRLLEPSPQPPALLRRPRCLDPQRVPFLPHRGQRLPHLPSCPNMPVVEFSFPSPVSARGGLRMHGSCRNTERQQDKRGVAPNGDRVRHTLARTSPRFPPREGQQRPRRSSRAHGRTKRITRTPRPAPSVNRLAWDEAASTTQGGGKTATETVRCRHRVQARLVSFARVTSS